MGREKDGLLDPKEMDGPVIKNTVADLLKSNPELFMTYHVMSTPFGLFNTVGVLLGGGLYGLGVRRPSSFPSALAMMGTAGLITGCGGMLLGLGGLAKTVQKGEAATPPWNADGIQQRIDGLSHNFKVRVLDLSVWSGMGLAVGALVLSGGPSKLKLSGGALGALQALSLGSALGGLGAFGCIYKTLPPKEEE